MFDMSKLPKEMQDFYSRVDASAAKKRDGVMQRTNHEVLQRDVFAGMDNKPQVGQIVPILAHSKTGPEPMSLLLERLELPDAE